jgi:hypothetical protein
MIILSRKTFLGTIASVPLWCSFAGAQADSTQVPAYLVLARELVQNTKSEDNYYRLGGQFISFPGDLLSNKYAVSADCSGFLLAIFARAKYPTQSQMKYLPGTFRRQTRPAAEDFVYSIETENGFKRIRHVRDLKPGDLLAHAMLKLEDQSQTGTTGHVFLIDSNARPIEAREPILTGTEQFEISVIDSNEEYVGADDTRLADPSNKIKGLGRGTIRIYADLNGELVGWARTFKNTKRFFSYDPRFPSDTKLRKAAVGRPITPT